MLREFGYALDRCTFQKRLYKRAKLAGFKLKRNALWAFIFDNLGFALASYFHTITLCWVDFCSKKYDDCYTNVNAVYDDLADIAYAKRCFDRPSSFPLWWTEPKDLFVGVVRFRARAVAMQQQEGEESKGEPPPPPLLTNVRSDYRQCDGSTTKGILGGHLYEWVLNLVHCLKADGYLPPATIEGMQSAMFVDVTNVEVHENGDGDYTFVQRTSNESHPERESAEDDSPSDENEQRPLGKGNNYTIIAVVASIPLNRS